MNPNVILDERDLKEVVEHFRKQKAFVFDTEAQGNNRAVAHLADMTWISLATKGTAVVVPFGHPIGDKIIGQEKVLAVYGPKAKKAGQEYYRTVDVYEQPPQQIDRGVVFDILRPLFFDPSITKIGHDVVYDLASSAKFFGAVPPPLYDDTKIDFWLLNENRKRFGLKEMTEEIYGHKYDYEGVGACVEKYPFSTVAYYSYCDAKYDWLHYLRLIKAIEEQGLMPVHDMEMNLLNVMVGMRLVGARVDLDRLHNLERTLGKEVVVAEKAIYQAAGRQFNVNSNPQKQTILYGHKPENQGLKPWKLTKGGKDKKKQGYELTIKDYSVDDEVLESYPDNPVAYALREYGDISKILSTYVVSYLGDNEKPTLIYDEHIHAGFMQYGTVTGRFSCRAPNLQNIPRPSSERGKLVRGIFIAEEGGKLVVADYGQIELVVLAHYVGEGKLYEGFMAGIDPHTMTAAMILDKDPADITKIERQDMGKTMNFAIVYGAGVYKVASMAHITPEEAKRKLKKHEQMFPEVHGFKDAVIDTARKREPVPYITTLLGRKRRVPDLNSSVEGIRKGAERQLFNSLIQGGAADLIKLSMIRVDNVLPPEIQLVLTVHDELVLSSPDGMVQEAASILREAMTGEKIQKHVRVPLTADVKIVNRWSDAK
jgi:DNA polymerase I-like protein with 3'-5' exonuclease and polymerase domains